MTKLWNDRPIASAGEDELGLQPFAASLAKGLDNMVPSDGMVVALHAPWGSGKTSALNLVERHLVVLDLAQSTGRTEDEMATLAAARTESTDPKEQENALEWQRLSQQQTSKRRTTVIRFNPWYFSGQESIFKAFFGVLGTTLSLTNDSAVAKAVAAVLKRGAAAGTAIGAASGMALGGPAGAAAVGTISGFFGQLANDKFDKVESLDESLKRLRDVLVQSDQHIVVIIDDIDRLMPDELRQMLTLLKSLGNLPRVTYLVAYDRDEVVELLKHARIDNGGYLEKIVQASFELPNVDRFAMRSLLFSRLDRILNGGSIGDEKRWGSAFFTYIDPYIEKPRDVTLLCNALQVMWPATRGEVDWTDLCVLQVIRLNEPKLFNLIKANLGKLSGDELQFSERDEWAQSLKPTAETAKKPEIAKEAMAYLFPRLAKAWNVMSFHSTDGHAAKRDRRLSAPEYARNYFALSPAPDQFSRTEIEGLFSSPEPLPLLELLMATGKKRKTRRGLTMVSRLIEQMTEVASGKIGLPDPLAAAALKLSDEMLSIKDEERTFFSIDNERRLSWLFVSGIRPLPPEQRATSVRTWMQSKRGLSLFIPFVETFTGSKNGGGEELIPTADHASLRDEALGIVKAASAEREFLSQPSSGRLLWAWVRLEDEATVRAWLMPKLAEDEAVVQLAGIMPSEAVSSDEGRYVYFDREAWEKLIDVDEFLNRLEDVRKAKAGDDTATAVFERFDRAIARKERF